MTRSLSRRTLGAGSFALIAALAACGGDSTSPGVPTALTAASTGPFSGIVGTALSTPFAVKVTDDKQRPVPNVTITFAITKGNGSVAPGVATTDANGQAQTTLTLSTTAGANEVTVNAAAVTASVKFAATGNAGPAAQALVLTRTAQFCSVGDSTRLRATVADQYGNETSGNVSWTTRDASAVSVDATGLVRLLKKGSATYVVATAGTSKNDSALVTTLAAVPVSAGQVITDVSFTSACISGASAGTYAVVAIGTSSLASPVTALETSGSGLGAAPSATFSPAASRAGLMNTFGSELVTQQPAMPDDAGETAFRTRVQRDLTPLVPGARAWYGSRGRTGGARFNSVPGTVKVGDIISMNVNGFGGCTSPTMRGVRVAALGTKSIIMADTANPAGGYSDTAYARIAATVDTMVYPMDVSNFGEPTDIDGNGRIVVIYTRVVNEQTPRGQSYYYGGVTNPRDLFPTTASSGFQACPASNVGEMFYMLAPDPDGIVNGNKRSIDFVNGITIGTVAHEFQHLINASRRLYILQQGGTDWVEEVWLNEGLSHIAEELLFYRATNSSPRANLDGKSIPALPNGAAAFNTYQIDNFRRHDSFLKATAKNSPYAANDELETRGATWSFLRYAADRLRTTDGDLWFRLVNGVTTGRENLKLALGVDENTLQQMFRDWAVMEYADDFVPGIDARYTSKSWNLRGVYPSIGANGTAFPLTGTALNNGTAISTSLAGGGFQVFRFTVPSGTDALVRVTGTGGTALLPGANGTLAIVRLK